MRQRGGNGRASAQGEMCTEGVGINSTHSYPWKQIEKSVQLFPPAGLPPKYQSNFAQHLNYILKLILYFTVSSMCRVKRGMVLFMGLMAVCCGNCRK